MQRKTLTLLIASFLLVLLIPLLIGLRIYEKAATIVEDDAIRYNNALLLQAKQSVDKHLDDINKLIFQVVNNERIIRFLATKSPLAVNQREEIIDILKDTRRISIDLSMYDSMFLYFFESDVLLTQTAMYDSRLYFISGLKYTADEYETMMDYLRTEPHNYRNLYQLASVSSSTQPTYARMQSLPISSERNNDAVLVVTLKLDSVQALMEAIKDASGGVVYVVDDRENIIATTADSLNQTYIAPALLIDTVPSMHEIDGDRWWVTSLRSDIAPIRYVSMIQEGVLLDQVTRIQQTTVQVLLLGLLAGIVVAVAATYRYHTRMKRLAEQAEEVSAENLRLIALWEHQKTSVADALLLKLLKGNPEEQAVLTGALEAYHILLDAPYYTVVITAGIARDKVETIRRRLLPQYSQLHITQELHHTVMIVALSTGDVLYDALGPLMIALLHDGGETLRAGISEPHGEESGLARAYHEANEALAYSFMTETSCVYATQLQSQAVHYEYSFELEARIIRAVRGGNMLTVRECLDTIVNENIGKKVLSLAMLRYLTIDMTSTLMKSLDEVKISYRKISAEHPMRALAGYISFDSFYAELVSLYARLCALVQEQQCSGNSILFDEIERYLQANYTDDNLHVGAVAQHFDLSASYLSRFYKEHKGMNLLDTITELRVRQAMCLLVDNPDAPIAQIAKMAGYANDAALTRAFKKTIGVTPGAYRKSRQSRLEDKNFS